MRQRRWWVPLTVILVFGLAAAGLCIQDVNAQGTPAFISVPDDDEAAEPLVAIAVVALSTTRVLDPSKGRKSGHGVSPHWLGSVAPPLMRHHQESYGAAALPDIPLRC